VNSEFFIMMKLGRPTSILSAGALGTVANPVNRAQVYRVELAGGVSKPLRARGILPYRRRPRRPAKQRLRRTYVQGSRTITGEHRKYIPAAGAYSGIVPHHPFRPWDQD